MFWGIFFHVILIIFVFVSIAWVNKRAKIIEDKILKIYKSNHPDEYRESIIQVSDGGKGTESILGRRILDDSKFLVHTDFLDKKYKEYKKAYRLQVVVYIIIAVVIIALMGFNIIKKFKNL